MSEIYLHPARFRGGAPAGTILLSDTPDDDDDGVAIVAVDLAGNTLSSDEKEALAAEICRRFNSGDHRTEGQTHEQD